MENEDYTKLIEFLGKKFDGIDQQFENIDKKFENVDRQFDDIKNNFATKEDLKAQAEEYLHQNKIMIENLEHRMDLLVEGFKMHDEKNERDKTEILEAITKLENENLHIRADMYNLNSRVKTLEEK